MNAGSNPARASSPPPPFERRGDALVPVEWARGPWREDTQHGGAMIGLLARAVERLPSDKPVQVVRLSVDLMRAAPLAAVEVPCRMVRAGRHVETVEASIRADGAEYVRATAMRFAARPIEVPHETEAPRAERFDEAYGSPRGFPFFGRVLEMCPGRGARGGMVWYRMRVPLVAGEPLTPLLRVAVAADFAYGTPLLLRARRDPHFSRDRGFTAINPDTTINLHRPPEGEWVGLESQLEYGPAGAGTAVATVWDESGPVGAVTQSILLRQDASQGISWEKLRGERAQRGRGGA